MIQNSTSPYSNDDVIQTMNHMLEHLEVVKRELGTYLPDLASTVSSPQLRNQVFRSCRGLLIISQEITHIRRQIEGLRVQLDNIGYKVNKSIDRLKEDR